ncbi:MAG: hypothetical protein HC853_09570 [Anaerolineae bacterium]|nr:hypothetical protein [Anaerolineae bacterium]
MGAVITLVLNFIPGIGQIISAILAFLDALVALITGGESTLGKLIVQFFYDVKIGTELKNSNFYPGRSGPKEPDKGLTDGSQYVQRSSFGANIQAVIDRYERRG